MKIRRVMLDHLMQFAKALVEVRKLCDEHNNYTSLYDFLQTTKIKMEASIAECKDIKVEVHNQKTFQIYKKTFEAGLVILTDVSKDASVLAMATYQLGIVFYEGANKIERLTTTQLKYFDSLLGMARKSSEKDRLNLIDSELESI